MSREQQAARPTNKGIYAHNKQKKQQKRRKEKHPHEEGSGRASTARRAGGGNRRKKRDDEKSTKEKPSSERHHRRGGLTFTTWFRLDFYDGNIFSLQRHHRRDCFSCHRLAFLVNFSPFLRTCFCFWCVRKMLTVVVRSSNRLLHKPALGAHEVRAGGRDEEKGRRWLSAPLHNYTMISRRTCRRHHHYSHHRHLVRVHSSFSTAGSIENGVGRNSTSRRPTHQDPGGGQERPPPHTHTTNQDNPPPPLTSD